jgi:hypothetical protein
METRDKINWLDDALAKAIGSDRRKPDFAKWQREHPEALQMLKSQATRPTQPLSPLEIGRIIMKSPITKLAAAAVIIIAVLAGIYFITGKTPSVTCCAWAQLADKVAQIDTCIYHEHSSATGSTVRGGKLKNGAVHYISSQYGYRADGYADGKINYTRFLLPEEKLMIDINPAEKQCWRHMLKDREVVEFRMNNKDPRYLLCKFIQSSYTELGNSVINGINVKGIEINHPEAYSMYDNFKVRVWVDIKTELPVRFETEIEYLTGRRPSRFTWDDFKWGVRLDPEVFKPNIPADYTIIETILPGQDEAAAIEALRKFVELTDGNFPSRPNGPTIRQESWSGIEKKYRPIRPNKQLTKEQIQARNDESMKLQGFTDFYMKLAQDGNQPAYYGKDVTLGDSNTVLMRWKISFDTYRVIFGDLNAQNVSAEHLKEIRQPTNQ